MIVSVFNPVLMTAIAADIMQNDNSCTLVLFTGILVPSPKQFICVGHSTSCVNAVAAVAIFWFARYSLLDGTL